ncbi:zinc finger protein 385C-like isoform X1 [Brienomyrus brachyistius]|uniref:zinc finger protein 385C-like isoform X1 n=1 Tax=Brienomyrus brachyistius TaxID=42636 RepID=UPI0020B2FD4A|nr:zinc finger protein 385C-like isoform X1 [Brienomyrus brachyistius]
MGKDSQGQTRNPTAAGMKSSLWLAERGQPPDGELLGYSLEGQHDVSEHRPRREKKPKTYTLCEVCNIQLNSSAQAQIHYNGKSHQKRLKQIGSSKQNSRTGTPTQSSTLLASLPVPGRPVQPQLNLKHLLPFRLDGSSPLSLFPNFNAMDPVQKAVINHTFGAPHPLKKKQIISCNICHLRFNSTNQAEAHYKGHKHARKLKALEAQKNRQRSSGPPPGREGREKAGPMERMAQDPNLEAMKLDVSPGSSLMLTPSPDSSSLELAGLGSSQVSPISQVSPQESPASQASPVASQVSECTSDNGVPEASGQAFEPGPQESPGSEGEPRAQGDRDPKKDRQHLHCPVCKVTVNSLSQLEAHNSGSKHKLMLEGQSVQPRRRSKLLSSRLAGKSKRMGAKGSVGVANKSFHCELCEIYVNSETQLKQHTNSRRHKDRLAGKPPRPKFSPHSKHQQSSVLANCRWSSYAGGVVSAMKKVFDHCSLTTLSPQTKLALQKQLTKGLTTSFLPSPLNPAALCTMAPNPLALRHPAGTTTLIQTPLLSPALFRPAPGPLRATHTPIIFSPY